VCADGEHTPPGFLFSGVMVQESWLDSSYIQSQSIKDLFNQSFIQATGKGSMTQQCFEMYIARHVVPHVRKRFPTGPLVILLDGPDTHALTATLAQYLLEHNVHFLYFPPNMTCKLQPLDRGVFYNFKKLYRKGKVNVKRLIGGLGNRIRLSDNIVGDRMALCPSPQTLAHRIQGLTINTQKTEMIISVAAWLEATQKNVIANSFYDTGIVPYCPEKWIVEKWCPPLKEIYGLHDKVKEDEKHTQLTPRSRVRESLAMIRSTIDDKTITASEQLYQVNQITFQSVFLKSLPSTSKIEK
jgi:hypothetical protein